MPEEKAAGAEAKELLQCMTWVGRRSAVKMCDRISRDMDRAGAFGLQQKLPPSAGPPQVALKSLCLPRYYTNNLGSHFVYIVLLAVMLS